MYKSFKIMKTILHGLKVLITNIIMVQSKILYIHLPNQQSWRHVLYYIIVGSSDGTLQVVDLRQQSYNSSQLCIKAHTKDVNVCDWNKQAKHLIVTGSDDCSVKVWDLRMTKKNKSISEELLAFKWHSEPISSIRFQPN